MMSVLPRLPGATRLRLPNWLNDMGVEYFDWPRESFSIEPMQKMRFKTFLKKSGVSPKIGNQDEQSIQRGYTELPLTIV